MRKKSKWLGFSVIGAICLVIVCTLYQLKPVSKLFNKVAYTGAYLRFVDRHGMPLNISYQVKWNNHDCLPFQRMPKFLVDAFLLSEDKNFLTHNGIDIPAKLNALENNLKAGKIVRGASTITEQVVRMLTNRKRTLWSKWLEAVEALSLEYTISKKQLLEFYLNQLPYASNRRGIMQAARFYFNREVETLSKKEILSLVILARSPSSYNLYHGSHEAIEKAINRLANHMVTNHMLTIQELQEIADEPLTLEFAKDTINATHFLQYVRKSNFMPQGNTIKTTLDGNIQKFVQMTLEHRIKTLKYRGMNHAAAIVLNHQTGEILAWNSVAADVTDGGSINSPLVPRQPGSTLKPFIYAMALEKGWDSLTIIEDAPLVDSVNDGLHAFRNYSNLHYGRITLRQALGNSLNIPAVKAIRYVGIENFLKKLSELGIDNLIHEANYYDEGLALGNGEVTLLNLTRAYAVLANQGESVELKYFLPHPISSPGKRIFSPEAVSVISNILSDPEARKIEFTANSILNFPIQTAVKTGTSTDFKDAWAVGYNSKYLVVIWMGNLDQQPMQEVTGSTGPALALRSIFKELNKNQRLSPLPISNGLHIVEANIELGGGKKAILSDYVLRKNFLVDSNNTEQIYVSQPIPNLKLAIDPRIPSEKQAFAFKINGMKEGYSVDWNVDGVLFKSDANLLWPIKKGKHVAHATVYNQKQQLIYQSESIPFIVY